MKKVFKIINSIRSNEDGWSYMETLIVIAISLLLTATVGFMAVGSLE